MSEEQNKPEENKPSEKMTVDDYFKQYNIDVNVERTDLTDEMAADILLKAAEALNSQKDKIEVVESLKDGAFKVLEILKLAGTVAAILA